MAIDAEAVRNWAFDPIEVEYTERDTMFYALSLGVGQDPTDKTQLRYVFERGLATLPTMAVVLGHPGSWLADPRSGVDYSKVVHGEQHTEFLAPLPTSGRLRCENAVEELVDKGEGKGALINIVRTIYDADSNTPLAKLRNLLFARADGGFGGSPESRYAALPACPDRAPDASFTWATHPNQALLYRLNSDMNPLHADPDLATRVGFRAPILHGLASFGIAGYGAVQAMCGGDAAKLRSLSLRLSAPVYPGETFAVDFWTLEPGKASVRARIIERDVVVLNNGIVTWSE